MGPTETSTKVSINKYLAAFAVAAAAFDVSLISHPIPFS